MKVCGLYLFLVSLSFSSVIIKGTITNLGDVYIQDANISFENYKLGTVSDMSGNFLLEIEEKDECILVVSHIGYEIFKKNIDCSVNQSLNVKLIDRTLNANKIVITGDRKETFIKDTPVLTHVVTSRDLENSAFSSVKDVLEMSLPNFQTSMSTHANFTNSNIKVQGLSDKNILFLLDGARVSGEFSGMLDFDMLDISNVERIEIVDGGMSSLYGSSAIGGVVNIISKKPIKPFTYKISYLYDNPLGISKNINLGYKNNIFSYVFNLLENSTEGYDLTMNDQVYDSQGGTYFKTLEKNDNISFKHNLGLNFKNRYFLNLKYKNYKKDIYVYEDYETAVNDGFEYYTAFQFEMPKVEDDRFGLSFKIKNKESLLAIDYNKERYIKSNFYFNYTNISNDLYTYNFFNISEDLIPKDFVSAVHQNESINIQYNFNLEKHNLIVGAELTEDAYSSFNIYKSTGDRFDGDYIQGQCDYPTNYTLTDCEEASIFGSKDDSKLYYRQALYVSDTFPLINKDIVTFSIRNVKSDYFEDKTVFSFGYMLKNHQPYDIRFNYSKGFRTPSIKELFYNFEGHIPMIVGNSDLLPSENDYLSLSVDKRIYNNSYSFEFFYNDVKNLIKDFNDTQAGLIQYVNIPNVVLSGFNCHYERQINNKNKIKFLFNYTDSYSENSELLNMISKYSLRLNYLHTLIDNQLFLSTNVKYSDKKRASNNVWLEAYTIADILFIFSLDKFNLKIGRKNIFNYTDDRRLLVGQDGYTATDYLSSYDPGRRYVFQVSFKY